MSGQLKGQTKAEASESMNRLAQSRAFPQRCDACKSKLALMKPAGRFAPVSGRSGSEGAPGNADGLFDSGDRLPGGPQPGHSISRITVIASGGAFRGASMPQMQPTFLKGSSPLIQAKLAISQPGDALEKEADALAEKVMAKTTSPSQKDRTPLMQMRRSYSQAAFSLVPPIMNEVLRSPGLPLDEGTRSFMEPRFGYNFGQVRVHADSKAAEAAKALNARAYTISKDIVFGSGHYRQGTSTGQRLLAHELSHVIQQNELPEARLQRQIEKSPGELWWNGLPDVPNSTPSSDDADICQKIEDNRINIHVRFMTSQKGKGFLYTAAQEATLPQRSKWDKSKGTQEFIEKHPDYQEGVNAAKEYQVWLSTASPSGDIASSTDPKKVAQWQLWQDISDEGDPSSMNTYDRPDIANVTWGRGFATSGGQLQTMMTRLFSIDPQARDLFYNAGITLDGNDFVVVDIAGHYKAKGRAAQRLIEFDQRLVSLFVNLAQGTFVIDGEKHRQAVLDVQFERFTSRGGTADIPSFALKWTRQARALVGHNIHLGGVTWNSFNDISGDLKSAIKKIAEIWGEKRVLQSGGSCLIAEKPSTLINRLKLRAKGIAMHELEGPFSTEIIPADPAQFNDPEKPHVIWTLSFWLQPDRVYFRAEQEGKYYRLKE